MNKLREVLELTERETELQKHDLSRSQKHLDNLEKKRQQEA